MKDPYGAKFKPRLGHLGQLTSMIAGWQLLGDTDNQIVRRLIGIMGDAYRTDSVQPISKASREFAERVPKEYAE